MGCSKKVEIWYSLQSDYCYFLLDRLLRLSSFDVEIIIRPVLGLVLRMPESTLSRSQLEQDYFLTDTNRTAAYLGLPYKYPSPSPIQFEPGSVWIASKKQPYVELLYRLFVGAIRSQKGLEFLDVVVRALWDGSQVDWHEGPFLPNAMADIGLNYDAVITNNSWPDVDQELLLNHEAMLSAGHWGVPLMRYQGEPFYGQDRFDQLLWRMGIQAD